MEEVIGSIPIRSTNNPLTIKQFQPQSSSLRVDIAGGYDPSSQQRLRRPVVGVAHLLRDLVGMEQSQRDTTFGAVEQRLSRRHLIL